MNRRNNRGFLLLEVLFASAIAGVALFALITSLGRCLSAARSIQNYTMAETMLANKSYEFRVERPTDMLDQEGVFADNPLFSWTRKFESTDSEGLWQQTITVYWYERGQLVSDSVVDYRYIPEKTN
jgi:type II secretion system protein I